VVDLPAASASPDGVMVELRRRLGPLNLDETQLATLAAVQRTWTEQHARWEPLAEGASPPAADYAAQIATIDALRDQEYRRVMGPETFTEFQKANDPRYQLMQRYASAWQLGPAEIDNVYETLNAHAGRVANYYQDVLVADQRGETVDWAAVDRTVRQLKSETEQTLRASLGAERFEKLQRGDVLRFAGDPVSSAP
jgi:hypothetical protein